MIKIRNIVKGFYNWLTGKERKLMKARLKVCNKCIQKDGPICSVCGCVLKAKASEPSEYCPMNKWPIT